MQPTLQSESDEDRPSRPTLQMLIEKTNELWQRQSERMSEPLLLGLAHERRQSEMRRGSSEFLCISYDEAVSDLANERKRFHDDLSRKGGKALRSDALRGEIEHYVKVDSRPTTGGLLRFLIKQVGEGVIDSIEEL
jgi:hypothetical protein